ncbi:hypothetical protein LIER_31988 [Lithospermum erythrorhizon]|uniref:Disease resistance protein winged helix domain-containing protein n=1 Tax=Lithospermum erythrorhizon TaxID=34254 RepID=A0AAV3RW54_LITER
MLLFIEDVIQSERLPHVGRKIAKKCCWLPLVAVSLDVFSILFIIPFNHHFEMDDVVRLWVTEGFIHFVEEISAEQIGRN